MIECELSGDESSTLRCCLRDDDTIRERCYDLIADREVVWLWLSSNREYGHESSSTCDDRLEQSRILDGIKQIDPRAKY